MGEKRSKRTKVIFATTALLVVIAALVSVAFFMNQTSTKPLESGYWILDISPSDPTFSTGYVEPNGTVHVPMNETGIAITATPIGINGFMYWRLDGEIVENQSSTIFVPKQQVNSSHTLEAVFVIGTPTLPPPTPSTTSSPSSSLPNDFPAPDVKPISPHYLRTIPDLFGNSSETRIFLAEANPRYGYYNETVHPSNPDYPEVHKGDPVFIINVTLRNDYTEDNPPPGGFDYNNASTIILKTQLYDKNGAIEARDVTPPYPGGFHVSSQSYEIKRGETISFDIYLLTSNREIDRFELYIYYIYSIPMP